MNILKINVISTFRWNLLGIQGLKLNILLPHPLILQYKYIIHCTTIDSDDSGSRMTQYNNRKKNKNHKMDLDLSSKCYGSVNLGRATSIDCLY